MRAEVGHASSQLACRSSPISDPGASILERESKLSQRKKKEQKERNDFAGGSLWKTAAPEEIDEGGLRQ
jgi:hypothetical protein